MNFVIRSAILGSVGTFALLGLLVACGDDHPPAFSGSFAGDGGAIKSGDGSAVGPDGAPIDPSDIPPPPPGSGPDGEAPVCNTITPGGSQVPLTNITTGVPSAQGGTIGPGTYVLVERDVFGGGSDGLLVKRTIVIDATKINLAEEVFDQIEQKTTTRTQTSTYSVFSDIGISMRQSCPSEPTVTNGQYTIDESNKLTIYFPDQDTADVYQKQ